MIITFETTIIRPKFFHRLSVLTLSLEITILNQENDVMKFFVMTRKNFFFVGPPQPL